MTYPVVIRDYKTKDFKALVEIDAEAFPTHNPVYDVYMYITFGSDLLVADIGGKVVGYIAIMDLGANAKIMSFAVKREFRRKGIGTKLLKAAIKRCKEKGKRKILLEVRISNTVAQHLYKKNGFKVIDLLPNYYNDGESAYLMALDLDIQNSNIS